MSPVLFFVAASALGIEVGWEPLTEGGHTYTIQMEPELLDVLRRGKDEIFSEVPPQVDVRRFRFLVGTGKLARDLGREARPPVAKAPDDAPPDGGEPTPAHEPPQAAKNDETPLKLPDAAGGQSAAKQTNFDAAQAVHAERPKLDDIDVSTASPARPWAAFVTALVILCCSLAANAYLGWTTWEARRRYRDMLQSVRPAAS